LRSDSVPWLLESALRGGPSGRFSFAGSNPYAILRVHGDRLDVELFRKLRPSLDGIDRELPWIDALRQWLPRVPDVDALHAQLPFEIASLPFLGGAVGYLGYELAESFEKVELAAKDDFGLADLVLLLVDRLVVFDHEHRRGWALGIGFATSDEEASRRAEAAASALAHRLRSLPPDAELRDPVEKPEARVALAEDVLPTFDASDYAKAVEAIQEDIAAGELYQANFTQRFERSFSGDPWDLYRSLRRCNPAPFAACIELPEVAILSSSPERYVQVDSHRHVESRPIKGTRPRHRDANRDAELAEELRRSEKDRAENLMIVDLVRNDLGRVCEVGSVRVPSLMGIEGYATVWQMVSSIEGRLREDCDALGLIAASFPPGSMTGAPKRAAMQIIDRHEPLRRSVYSGALGYFDLRGGLDLSVVIRTLMVREGRAYLNAGGGIVADSRPADEYEECLDKARALFDALDQVEA